VLPEENRMVATEKDYIDCYGYEENEPQIKAPRVTPLEGVSAYAPQGIRVCGVENPQGFGIDERRFVALNLRLSAFICG